MWQKYAGVVDEAIAGVDALLCPDEQRAAKGKGKKGAEQLADNVARMLAGAPVTSAFAPHCNICEGRDVIPVIVAFEQKTVNDLIRKRVDERFRKRLVGKQLGEDKLARVKPLLLLGVADVELLECVSHVRSVEETFRGYADAIARGKKFFTGISQYIAKPWRVSRHCAGLGDGIGTASSSAKSLPD